jgi:hypothetical protein
VFGPSASQGILIDGSGTNRALVEFVDGFAILGVADHVAEVVRVGGEDTGAIGVEFLSAIMDDFESSDGGYTLAGQINDVWKWGVPTSGPGFAASGSRVWATNLDGEDQFFTLSELRTPTIAIPIGATPMLEFESWLEANPCCEFGFVEISVDGGSIRDRLDALTGFVGGYARLSYDLAKYAGKAIRIHFLFIGASFEQSASAGWYIDDVTLWGLGGNIDFLAPNADADSDGLSNADELALGTDPRNSDVDLDGVPDGADNCPFTQNADQHDQVHPNGIGDACDEPDGDGRVDLVDNCPDAANPDQSNADGDRPGDACDPYPDAKLYMQPVAAKYGLTGAPVKVSYELRDFRDKRADDVDVEREHGFLDSSQPRCVARRSGHEPRARGVCQRHRDARYSN